jgi:hypothetical protein
LQQTFQNWEKLEEDYRRTLEKKLEGSREKLAEVKRELGEAGRRLRAAIRNWQETHRLVLAQCA